MNHVKTFTTGVLATLCLLLMSFSIADTTKPKTGINNSFTGNISLQELKKLDALTIDVTGDDLNVISFRLVVAPRYGEAYMKRCNGNGVAGRAFDKVKSASVGDRILLDKVVAQYSNGLKTFCNSASIIITE